jgi:hypothetical protein
MVMCARVWAAANLLFSIAFIACSGADDGHPAGPGDDPGMQSEPATNGASGQGDPCTDFAKRDCVIDLGVSNGVHNCAKGVQICEQGAWTACAVLDP